MSAFPAAGFAYRNRGLLARAALVAFLAVLALVLLAAGLVSLVARQSGPGVISPIGLPAGARPFLRIYEDAAQVYAVNPFVLMAIHENETNYSQSTLPGVRSGVNFAGCCAGPMQFSIGSPLNGGAGGTWAAYRHAYHKGRLDRPGSYPLRFERPHPNVYDSYDAIYAAAAYLHALGAGPRIDQRTFQALLSYTGVPPASIPYARHDYERARELQALAQTKQTAGPLALVPGSRARLLANGLAAAPTAAPPAVKGMIAAANQISGRPYLLRHYPTHLDSPTYDCSSSTSHVLWGGGRFGTAPWVSGQLMLYGQPGPGRWVAIYAHSGHAFLYVAGLRFDTSSGYDTGPNAGESGPRWRIGPRPLTGFAVRHPRGL